MNDSSENSKAFAEWIAIATSGLIAPARERIRREIESHFTDTVEASVAIGMSRDKAETAAVKALGDARTAACTFRKNHITEWEDRDLKLMRARLAGKSVPLSRKQMVMIVILSATSSILHDAGMRVWDLAPILVIAVGLGADHLKGKIFRSMFSFRTDRLWSPAETVRFLKFNLIVDTLVILVLALSCWFVSYSSVPATVALGIVCLVTGAVSFSQFQLWRKLDRIQDNSLGTA